MSSKSLKERTIDRRLAKQMDDDARVKKMIKDRICLADIHKTNFVYFTPSERERVMAWLESQPKEGDGDAG